MAQARAGVTRQKILDAAVELFADVGYSDTDLGDVVTLSGMTKGAFYYHFAGKDALASAIIQEAETEFQKTIIAILTSSPALENLVLSTFVAVEPDKRDKLTRVANELRAALSQVGPGGAEVYKQRQAVVLEILKDCIARGIAEGDLRADIDVADVAHTIWAASLGNRILAAATGGDVFAGIAGIWRVVMPAIATPAVAPYFVQFVNRMAAQYARAQLSGP